jgi:hypothetical protein
MKGKEVPVLVKVIAVLNYVSAGGVIIGGLLFLFASSFLSSVLASSPLFSIFGSAFFIVIGILMLGLGILSILVGRGLWRGKSWARILEIVLRCLAILGSLNTIVSGQIMGGIFVILISSAIAGYLLFNKQVKEAFKK